MAAKSKIVRIVGKLTHPLMNWSDISDQESRNRSTSESSLKQRNVELGKKSASSNDSMGVTMKNEKRNSKTSSLDVPSPSSTGLGAINSQIKLYVQRRLGRLKQETSVNKSNNVIVSDGELFENPEGKLHSSKASLNKTQSAILEKPAETSIKVKAQKTKPKIKKKVKLPTPKSPSSSKTEIANPISNKGVDVDLGNKKRSKNPRPKSPPKRNRNLKAARNKTPETMPEVNDEIFEVDIQISGSETEGDIKPSKEKATNKKRSERISRKAKKVKKINAVVAEGDSNVTNIDLPVTEENSKVEEIPAIQTTIDEESDHSRPKILHIKPQRMGRSEIIVEDKDQDSAGFPLDTIGIEDENNAERKVIIMELKPSEVNKSENAWKLSSQRLKERFTKENFAHLDSDSSVSELSDDEKPLEKSSKIIANSSPSAYLIVNSEHKISPSHLSQKLPIDEMDHLEMRWRMEAMKQLLRDDLDRELLEDIVLKVGKYSYGCFRLLLVLTSRFFRQQLRSGNLEPFTTPELKIEAADEKAVAAVFGWMHTAEIDLNMTNIGEILHLCDILGIDSLAEKCQGMLEVLREHDGDAVSLYEYAAENQMGKVAKEAASIASDNFLKLVYGETFLGYTYKQMCMLLTLEDLRVNSELEVFYAVWRWLTHSWNYRKRYKDHLIRCVDLEKMSQKEVQVLAETLIESEWGAENPLTWGADGYMTVGLIRGLLSGKKKHGFGWNKRSEEEPAAIVAQKPVFEGAVSPKRPAISRKKKKMRKRMAARIIQTAYNQYKARKREKVLNSAAVEIQRRFRGFVARKKMKERTKAAVVIQRAFRKAKDHERRKKLLRLAAPKRRKRKYVKRNPAKRKILYL